MHRAVEPKVFGPFLQPRAQDSMRYIMAAPSKQPAADAPAVTARLRPRRTRRRRMPTTHRVTQAALRLGRSIAPMHGLLQLDVTEARPALGTGPDRLSFTAFVVAAVARAAAQSPGVHAYRDWRGRLVTHDHVDVATIVETETPDGAFPLAIRIADADVRSVRDITDEIRTAQADPGATTSGRLTSGIWWRMARLPGVMRTVFWLGSRTATGRRRTATVAVTAVGMFAGGGGFGLSAPTVNTLTVVVGGVSRRPAEHDGAVAMRDILDLTVSLDHNVVDGAPAARFVADLRRLIEEAALLRPGV